MHKQRLKHNQAASTTAAWLCLKPMRALKTSTLLITLLGHPERSEGSHKLIFGNDEY